MKKNDLISCLLADEQNNELLMKNHQSCPTGSTSFPEANVIIVDGSGHNWHHDYGCDRGRDYYNQNSSIFRKSHLTTKSGRIMRINTEKKVGKIRPPIMMKVMS
jgi:hypothetical protein